MGATPYDIVLVLDKSSSMSNALSKNEDRMKALKRIAKDFIKEVYDSTNEGNVKHRIAIATFSGGKTESQCHRDATITQ